MAEPKRCPFCGRTLQPRTAKLMGKDMFLGWEECSCPGAIDERKRQDRERQERHEEEEERELEQRMRLSGVGKRFLDASNDKAGKLADAMEGGKNLYLHGPVGTGKTTCAAATMREILKHGHKARFVRMCDAIEDARMQFRTGERALAPLEGTPFLFLDDLGKEQPTGFVMERIFALIDMRSADMKPICVTTQYSPSELSARLSQQGDPDTAAAIVSRLMQQCVRIKFGGKDRRIADNPS